MNEVIRSDFGRIRVIINLYTKCSKYIMTVIIVLVMHNRNADTIHVFATNGLFFAVSLIACWIRSGMRVVLG